MIYYNTKDARIINEHIEAENRFRVQNEAERRAGADSRSSHGYVAPTKTGARSALQEMLAALKADDSDRYWKAYETLTAMHIAVGKPPIGGDMPQNPAQ